MKLRRPGELEGVIALATVAGGPCTCGGSGGAGAPADGGREAGSGMAFCSALSPQPTFCADFDEGPGSLSAWVIETTNAFGGTPDAGTVAIDTTVYHSPPASLDVSTHPATGSMDFPQAKV